MQAFRDALSDCNLEDLGYSGDPFTWKRGRMRERLDRVVVNGVWQNMHPGGMVQHMEFSRSDHRPLLLDTEFQSIPNNARSSSQRFEAKWLHEKKFNEVVEQAWEAAKSNAADVGVLGKLAQLHQSLHDWDGRFLKRPKNVCVRPSKNLTEL